MAISNTKGPFNPDTADVSPVNYLGLSKPIDSFNLSSVLGTALKGAGDILEGSLKATDELVKASAREDVRNQIEPERDAYTTALKGANTYVKNIAIQPNIATDAVNAGNTEGGSPGGMPIQAGDAPQSLITPTSDLPADLKALPERLGILSNARGNGKISETDYYGRLTTIAKDIRSKYPVGYRDYIDSEIAKVTGVDPANAYIKGMISDINSFMTNSQTQRNGIASDLRQEIQKGLTGSANMLVKFLNGASIEETVTWLEKAKAEEYRLGLIDKRIKNAEGNIKFVETTNKVAAGELFTGIVQKQFHGIEALPGKMSPADLQQLSIRAQAGDIQLSSEDATKYAYMAAAMKAQAEAEIDQKINSTKLASTVSPQDLNAMKAAAVLPLDTMIKAFSKQDVALAAFTTNLVTASRADATYKVVSNKDVGNIIKLLEITKNAVGDAGQALLLREIIAGPEWSPFITGLRASLGTPKDALEKPDARMATSFSDAIDKIKNVQEKTGTKGQFPQHYQALVNMVTDPTGYSLINSTLPVNAKEQIAQSFFGPENRDSLRKIAPDIYDPKTGKVTPGYQSVYYGFTRPEVVSAINQLSPATKAMYEDWVRTSVREDLFKEDISKFKTMALSAGDVWNIKWDTNSKKLEVIRGSGNILSTEPYRGRIPVGRGGPISLVEQTVNSLNKGLDGLVNVARGFGKQGDQVDAYVLQELVDAGVGADRVAGIPGIPNAIAEAISTAYKSQKLKNEMMKQKLEDNKKKFEGR